MEQGGEVIAVILVVGHPSFSSYTLDYDFTLLRLAKNIVFDGVTRAAIKLPAANEAIADGSYVLVSGWGLTKNSNESNEVLRGVVIPTTNQNKCYKMYEYDGGVTKQMVCAGSLGKDSCNVSQSFIAHLKVVHVFPSMHSREIQVRRVDMFFI